jgi:hypothetical protein
MSSSQKMTQATTKARAVGRGGAGAADAASSVGPAGTRAALGPAGTWAALAPAGITAAGETPGAQPGGAGGSGAERVDIAGTIHRSLGRRA